jgi:hypothetical protein
MNITDLKAGYFEVLRGIYNGKPFYQRVRHFLSDFEPQVKNKNENEFQQNNGTCKINFYYRYLR